MTKPTSNRNINTMGKTGWAAMAVLMLGLAVLAGFYFDQNTRISAVEFTGFTFTPEEDMRESFETPVGVLADSVDYEVIYRSMRSLPWVRDISVRMTFRGVLSVDVDERQPIGLIAGNSQKIFFDSDGVLLPAMLGHHVDVPVVYGFNSGTPGDTLNGAGFEQVRNFLTEAKSDPFSWSTISEVAWNEAEGVVALSSENGVKLLFGHGGFNDKVKHWKAFYSEVVARKGINSFRSVDLRFRNQIVTDEI